MPDLDGYQVWLEVDGEALREYPDRGDVEYPPSAGAELVGLIQSYVISAPGKNFCICWSAPEGVDVQAELSVESTTLALIQLRHDEEERVIRETGPGDVFGVNGAFVFEHLDIDVKMDYGELKPPPLGTIKVDLTTGTFGRSNPTSTAKPSARQPPHEVSQHNHATPRMRGTNDIAHEQGFANQTCRFYPRQRRIFLLKYNSRALLEAGHMIPTEEQERHVAELACAKELHAEEMILQRERHGVELALQLQRHNAQMTAGQDRHAAELEAERQRHTAEKAAQQATHDAQMQVAREEYEAQVRRMNESLMTLETRIRELVDSRSAHDVDLQSARERGRLKLRDLELETSELQKANDEKIQRLEAIIKRLRKLRRTPVQAAQYGRSAGNSKARLRH